MPVLKREGSPYYHYEFQFRGRRFRGSTGCRKKRDAEEFERRERQRVSLPSQERQTITLDLAAGLYSQKAINLPSWPTTRYLLTALVDGLGTHRLLSEISHLDLQGFFMRRKVGRSNATVNREIDNARAMWRYAETNRFNIGEMPGWRAMKLKEPRKAPRELSFDEEALLMQAIRADIRDAVDFLLKSGWRRNEVLDLRWSDCNFTTMTAVTRIKGGDHVSRPLTKHLAEILERQPRAAPQVFTYLCQQSRDKRCKGERYPLTPTALRGPFEAALKRAGIENFRLHDLRHTRGTRIVRQTGSLAAAKEALKHRSISTTLRYAHVLDDDTRRALEASESHNIPTLAGSTK